MADLTASDLVSIQDIIAPEDIALTPDTSDPNYELLQQIASQVGYDGTIFPSDNRVKSILSQYEELTSGQNKRSTILGESDPDTYNTILNIAQTFGYKEPVYVVDDAYDAINLYQQYLNANNVIAANTDPNSETYQRVQSLASTLGYNKPAYAGTDLSAIDRLYQAYTDTQARAAATQDPNSAEYQKLQSIASAIGYSKPLYIGSNSADYIEGKYNKYLGYLEDNDTATANAYKPTLFSYFDKNASNYAKITADLTNIKEDIFEEFDDNAKEYNELNTDLSALQKDIVSELAATTKDGQLELKDADRTIQTYSKDIVDEFNIGVKEATADREDDLSGYREKYNEIQSYLAGESEISSAEEFEKLYDDLMQEAQKLQTSYDSLGVTPTYDDKPIMDVYQQYAESAVATPVSETGLDYIVGDSYVPPARDIPIPERPLGATPLEAEEVIAEQAKQVAGIDDLAIPRAQLATTSLLGEDQLGKAFGQDRAFSKPEADALVQKLSLSADRVLPSENFNEWSQIIQDYGLDEALARWNQNVGKGGLTPDDLSNLKPTNTNQYTDAQALRLAQQIAINLPDYYYTGEVTEDGRRIASPLDYGDQEALVNSIATAVKNYGPEAAVDFYTRQLQEMGAETSGNIFDAVETLRPEFMPRDLATDIMAFVSEQSGYSKSNLDNWITKLQNEGLEKTLAEYAEVNPPTVRALFNKKPDGLPIVDTPLYGDDGVTELQPTLLQVVQKQFPDSMIQEARQAYATGETGGYTFNLDQAVQDALAYTGEDPNYLFQGTGTDLINRLYLESGYPVDPENRTYQELVNIADSYGTEAALNEFNRLLRTPFGQSEIGLGVGSGAGAYDPYGFLITPGGADTGAVGGDTAYQPTTTAPGPAYQPGLPGALPAGRSLLTTPERPLLAPRTGTIPIGAATTPVEGEAMQAYGPEQFGLTTFTPEQYMELARAAALQEPSGQDVNPFSETAAANQGGLKGGGSVSGLKAIAQDLQSKGRNGDTILAHINPQEAEMLKAMGGSGTINPATGLREYGIFGRGGIDINIGKKSQRALAAAAGVAAGFGVLPTWAVIPGMSQIASTAVLTGIAGGLGNQNFSEGLQLGLTAYGSGQLASYANQAFPAAPNPQGTANVGPNPAGNYVSAGPDGYTASSDLQNLADIPPGGDTLAKKGVEKATESTILGMSPTTALLGGTMAASLYGGEQERKAFERQNAAYMAQVEDRKRRGRESFARSYMPTAAGGGLMSLAKGGIAYSEGGGTTGPANEPRMVKGNGDGMSDSVPATIEGVQEARLANDEFVIPADVVADIGNGSSSAGAKQLYAMMDRVRQARHGTTEQPPEINATKLMPA